MYSIFPVFVDRPTENVSPPRIMGLTVPNIVECFMAHRVQISTSLVYNYVYQKSFKSQCSTVLFDSLRLFQLCRVLRLCNKIQYCRIYIVRIQRDWVFGDRSPAISPNQPDSIPRFILSFTLSFLTLIRL